MTKTAGSPFVRVLKGSVDVIFCLTIAAGLAAPRLLAQSAPSGPKIWLQENQPLAVQHVPSGQGTAAANLAGLSGAQPVAVAAADLDGDGFQDLVVGYSAGGAGFISVHRGNIDAFAPQSDESFQAIGRGQFPSPFLLEAQTFPVPVSPDFIVLGDFLGSGNQDLAIAARGGNTLYVFPGDGKGNFGAPQAFSVAGEINTLAAGRFGASHQSTMVLGLSGSGKNLSLVLYTGNSQGLAPVGGLPLSGPASNILFGDFSDSGNDIAFLSGGKVHILRPNLKLTTVSIPGSVSAFALGSFIHDRTGGQQIAALTSDGGIHVIARSDFDPRVYTVDEFAAIRGAKINHLPPPSFVPLRSFPTGWKVVESFPSVGSPGAGQTAVFFQTRISVNGADDIMWLNPGRGQMVVISHPDGQPGAQTFLPGRVSVKPYNGSPLAALPMRLNVDGRPGVLAIHQGEVAPSLSEPIPDPTFFVNTDNDPTPTSPITNACNNTSFTDTSSSCSLREAVLKANGDTIQLQSGHTYSLTIGRGATQDYSGNTGALYVNNSTTIVGGNQNTSIIQWGTPSSGTVDMVMAVNEDHAAGGPTNATASLSNLTIQNGVNHGTQGVDGDGGCMEFDTGSSGTATLTLTNVTLQNCSTLQGSGGGLAIFNSLALSGAGGVTIQSNSIIQGNSVVASGQAGNGGGIAIFHDGHMTMTASQVKNNNATQNDSNGIGFGGGIAIFAPQNISAASAETFIHSSTISGNKAAGFGGGINSSGSISIDQTTVISGNTAGTDGTNTIANQEGGGLYLNPQASCPLSSTCTATISKVTITGNTATGNGGGISYGKGNAGTTGSLTMSFSRLTGNNTSGGNGSNLNNNNATATVTDNWWGTNSPAGTINTISGTTTFDPFIVLSNSPTTSPITLGQTTPLTASFLQDNQGHSISASSLDVLLGLPITFNNAIDGLLSNPETAIQPISIGSATESGNIVTITTSVAHGYTPGAKVVIAGAGVAGYNGTFNINNTPTSTTFTYSVAKTGLANSTGGTASVGAAGTAIVTFQATIVGTGQADATVDNGTATANISIQKGNTTTSATSSNNPAAFSQTLTFIATITPNGFTSPPAAAPTGPVQFFDNGTLIGTGNVSGSTVFTAKIITSALAVGNHTITATYLGDSNYIGSTGPLIGNPQKINPANTSTKVTSSANPSVFGQSVTFSATVSDTQGTGTPTGTVNFVDAGTTIGTGTLSGGVATFTTSALAVGNHTITASYSGDGNFNGSTGSLTPNAGQNGNPQVVNKDNTSTTVTSSANPSVFGQSVTFTATVSATLPGSGSPTGTVTFLDAGSSIGSGTLSGGIATFTTSALALGNHTITTSYGGDGNFNGSTGALTGNPQVVNKDNSTTTVTSSANPSVFGQSVTFTATVSPVPPGAATPTGVVTFLDGGSSIGSGTLSGGIATFTSSALVVGTHTITTSYGGDGNFNGGTGALGGNPQVVNKDNTTTTLTSSVNPSVFGQSVTFTATVSAGAPGAGTPTGTVTFLDGGSPVGTGTLVGGTATFVTSALAAGNHTITSSYGGDGNFTGSTGVLAGNQQLVNKADTSTTLTSAVNPSVFGQSVTFTATVSPLAPGAGTPTGTVTFLDGGISIGTGTLAGGIATFTTSALLAGNHTISTSYNGDGNFNGDTGELTGNPQVVNKANTTTTVASSVNPAVFGQSVTFTATVSPVAPGAGTSSGTVAFLDGGTTIGTGTLVGGIATFTTSALAAGNHTITTSYSGDANFNGDAGSLIGNPQVVNQANTSMTVISSQNPQTAGQPLAFTATVSAVAPGSGTPTGTVIFLDGGNQIGSGTLNGGIATYTTSALTPGKHTITTSYSGDGNFNSSTGSLTGNPQVINRAATTISVAASQGAITLGDTVTFTATVTAAAGTATGLVTFFDDTAPMGSAPLNGNAQGTFSTSLLSASGSPHSITAIYQGVTDFAPSSSSAIAETVNTRTSTTGVILNPATVVVGQSSIATVTVTDSGAVPPGTADVFSPTGVPATGRSGFTSTLFTDGLLLVAGGTDANNNVLNSAEVYNVSGGTFSSTGNLNTGRTGAVAVLLPTGKVLVAGGSSDRTANGALNSAELLDPNTGTFVPTSQNMTAQRFGATINLLNNGKVLIAGGINSGGVLNSAELYDPNTDTFTATGNMNSARTGASATLLGTQKVLMSGGSSDGTANGALNSAEVFDPAGNGGAGTFTSVSGANPTLAAGRWQSEAALLVSGKVLVAGGQNSGGALASADIYDPAADSFTASNQSMSQARANGSAVTLPSGMVLLAGGTTSQAVDLYDADSDRFNSTGGLQQSDSGLGSTLLNNGQVLVIGLTTAATPASDAELYSPSFNPQGTVAVNSSEATDSITGACTLTPSTTTASTCTSTVTPANVATSPHTITGTYSADAVHSTGSNTAPLTVNKADTTTTVTSSVNPSVFGQSVTFTATVSPAAPGGGTPTGTVTFFDGGSPIGIGTLSGGIASFTTSALASGNHNITTSYSGDGNFNGNTGSLTGNPQVVNKANTSATVSSSLNPSVFGQSVTFTATVSAVAPGAGIPTGTVTFLDGGTTIGTATLGGGIATFTASAFPVGNHTITTSYAGDGNFNGSTSSLTGNPQAVNKANTSATVSSSLNPSVFGQSVTFTATISALAPGAGTPTGTVTFLDGASTIGTGTLSGGIATFTSSTLLVGNHTITTSYAGDGSFNGSTGSLTGNPQVVNKANSSTTLTSPANPSVFGQSVTFTATVSPVAPGAGTPTGTVTFLDGASTIGTGTLSGGIATFTTSALAVGNHTISTSYAGDGNFNGSTGSLTGNPQVVNKANAATTVASSANPTVFGQPVTVTATVSAAGPGSGTPTGTVTFLDGGSTIGTGTLSGGIATFTSSTFAVGNHAITTSYGGDGNFNGSTGSLTGNPQVVNKANAATTVTSSANPSVFGQSVTFTATVSAVAPGAGTPTGTVAFLDGGSTIGAGTLSGGVATFTSSALGAGSHTITTSYAGDGNFNAGTGALTGNPQVVNKANTTANVTSSQNPSALGQSVSLTATVTTVPPGSGTPTGTVTFLDGGNTIGTGTLSGGVAAFTTSGLPAGSHTITASYSGGSNFNGATGSLTGNPQVVVAPPVIAKAFNPASIQPNGVSTMILTITNPSVNTVAAQGVAFNDSFPANLVVATPNGLTNSCGGTATASSGSGSVSLSGGTIAVNSSCTINVNVTAIPTGSYLNATGAVSSTNGGTGNTASATLTVVGVQLQPSLTIIKTHEGTFNRGQDGAKYNITVGASANGGPTAGTVTVVDTLPPVQHTLEPTAMSGTGWSCTLSTLTCTRSDQLNPGASYPPITLTVNVPQNIVSHFINTATVSGGGDPNSHQATDDVKIWPPVHISSSGPATATISAGNPAIFQFQLDTTAITPQPALVTFSCSGLPPGATSTFSQFGAGQSIIPVTLVIKTNGPAGVSTAANRRIPPMYAALMFPVVGLIGVGLASKGKRARVRLTLILMALLAMAALAGCGGGGNGLTVTPQGQYLVTITGTTQSDQGPVSGSTTVTLNVQ